MARDCAPDPLVAKAKLHTPSRKPAQNTNLVQECIEQVCKDPSASFQSLLQPATLYQPSDEESRELVADLGKWLLADLDFGLTQTQAYSRMDISRTEIKNPFLIAMNRLFGLIYDTEFDLADFEVKDEQYLFKVEAMKKIFPMVEESERAMMIRLISRFMTTLQATKTLGSESVERLSLHYPSPNLLRRRLEEIFVEYDANLAKFKTSKLSKDVAHLFSSDLKIEALKALYAGEVVTSADLLADDQALTVLAVLTKFSDEDLVRADVGDRILGPVEIGFEQNYKESISIRTSDLEKQKQDPKKTLLDSKCIETYLLSMSYSPSASQIATARSREKELRSRFNDLIKAHLSKEESTKILSEIASWSAEYPLSKDEWKKRFLARLKIRLAEFLSEDHSKYRFTEEILAAILPIVFRGSYELDAVEFCKDNLLQPISDGALAANLKFSVGPANVQLGEKAHGVVFHELGHLLSATSARFPTLKKSVDRVKSCLSKQYPNPVGDDRKEEDFADWLSFKLESKNNLACVFARKDSPEEYSEIKFNSEGEPHSSHLFRTMHGASYSDQKIPAVCVKAVQSQGAKPNFRACEFPKLSGTR